MIYLERTDVMAYSGKLLKDEVVIVKGRGVAEGTNVADDSLKTALVEVGVLWFLALHEPTSGEKPESMRRRRALAQDLAVDLEGQRVVFKVVEDVGVMGPDPRRTACVQQGMAEASDAGVLEGVGGVASSIWGKRGGVSTGRSSEQSVCESHGQQNATRRGRHRKKLST